MINHIINKQVIDLRLPQKEGAWLLQQQMKELYQTELLNVLDAQFSKLVGDGEVLRIDKIEIDLGTITKDQLAQKFREKLNELLPEKIAELKTQAVIEKNKESIKTFKHDGSTADKNSELEQTTLTEQFVNLLDQFFTTGNIPWWGNSQERPISIVHVFERALRDESVLLRAYLQKWIQQDAILKRLILQIPQKFDPLVLQLLCETRIATGVMEFFKSWNASLLNDHRFKNDLVVRRVWLYKTSAILANPVIAMHRVATETESIRIQTAFLQAAASMIQMDVQDFEKNVYRGVIENSGDRFVPESLISWLVLWEKREIEWVRQFSGGEARLLDVALSVCTAIPVALIGGQSNYERVQHFFKKINTDTNQKFERNIMDSLANTVLKKAALNLIQVLRHIRKETSVSKAVSKEQEGRENTSNTNDDVYHKTHNRAADETGNMLNTKNITTTSTENKNQKLNATQKTIKNAKRQSLNADQSKFEEDQDLTKQEVTTEQKPNQDSSDSMVTPDSSKQLIPNTANKKSATKQSERKKNTPNSDEDTFDVDGKPFLEKKEQHNITTSPEKNDLSSQEKLEEKTTIQKRLSSWVEEIKNDPFSKSWEATSSQSANTTSLTSDPIPFFTDEPEEAQTQWAGLVLLTPFLQMFFNNLQLTGDQGFVDVAAQEKAVFILHYAACKKTKAEEHELALHKILCGLPIDYPLPSSIKLTKDEKEETNNLLDAVASQWSVLHTDSGQAIRQSFLRRNGLIRKQDGAWLVRIERESIDILIDSLPWGFSIIKTGWMQQLIQVEW
ncbi:MAG: contractile injection system tape measure protein [Bacteroidia bacterium]